MQNSRGAFREEIMVDLNCDVAIVGAGSAGLAAETPA
jgi:ribulose 1,5-bisphosphate synthetase/thiazole synthase